MVGVRGYKRKLPLSGRNKESSGEDPITCIPSVVIQRIGVDIPLTVVSIPVHVNGNDSTHSVANTTCTTAR